MTECNESTGCAIPEIEATGQQQNNQEQLHIEHQVIFVTDTICSHCWAIEPAWRRLLLSYDIKARFIHGGLLPGWAGFADSGNAISKPTDVIPHWEHVAQASGQPIDASVWADDPLSNSYILCKAAIAVRLLKPQLESLFVRKMREWVFLDAVNIAKTAVLADCAEAIGIERESFLTLLDCEKVDNIFTAERREMQLLGARGFPSLIFLGDDSTVLVGARPYQQLEAALLRNSKQQPQKRHLSDEQKLKAFDTWTLTEASEVLQAQPQQAQQQLKAFGFAETDVKAGTLWVKN